MRLGKFALAAFLVPRALRRGLAGIILLGLIMALGVAVIVAIGHRSAAHRALPCPPQPVKVHYDAHTPASAQGTVTRVIEHSGRTVDRVGNGAKPDFSVRWWSGSAVESGPRSGAPAITVGQADVRAATVRLAMRSSGLLTSCPAHHDERAARAPDEATTQRLPWRAVPWLAPALLALAAWWVIGPQVVRGTWRALWPARLGRRAVQRTMHRRRLARGEERTEWPLRADPGQRWHENPAAMRDRRTHRQQVSETEPERRAALKALVREERLTGSGVGPARAWRVIYRVPQPEQTDAEDHSTEPEDVGAPEAKQGVSS